jgi:hypothetical protein
MAVGLRAAETLSHKRECRGRANPTYSLITQEAPCTELDHTRPNLVFVAGRTGSGQGEVGDRASAVLGPGLAWRRKSNPI